MAKIGVVQKSFHGVILLDWVNISKAYTKRVLKMKLNTPVVLIIFNRPEPVQEVFNAIRQAQPTKLLVIADGPRFPEEAEKCEKTKQIVSTVDWDCEVLTNYSEINLGLKIIISSGLDWVFNNVEEAIILEDDCLPSQSFFVFCQSLLEMYRYDTRVMSISGNNFQMSPMNPYSYFFSKYFHCWGWATWRRSWKYYDIDMKTFLEFKKRDTIKAICNDVWEQKYWLDIFEKTYNGQIKTWDYQWLYASWINHALSIYPNLNLVSNLGFGKQSTNK
jgi:hypothetical protein